MVKSEEVKKSPKSGSCPRYAPGTTAEPCLPCVITKTGLDIGRYICSVSFGDACSGLLDPNTLLRRFLPLHQEDELVPACTREGHGHVKEDEFVGPQRV